MGIIEGIAEARRQIIEFDYMDPHTVCLNIEDYYELRKEAGEIFTFPGGLCVRVLGLNVIVSLSLKRGEMKIF